MRRVVLAFLIGGCMVAVPGVSAQAAEPMNKPLPPAACNQGTMNAHEHIGHGSDTTPNGRMIEAHFRVPNESAGFCATNTTMPG